jgi:hypothetical protein
MTTLARNSNVRSVEERVCAVGQDLTRAFSKVLDAIPGAPHRPQLLARRMGLNAVLTSRLLKATQQSDPIAVAHTMPGPEPLRRLLRAAEKQKIDRSLLKQASVAVDRFQQLIDAEAGDRSALDAIISGWLPDARETVELNAKQAAFRGISHLLGTANDAAHYTFVLYPTLTDSNRADEILILNTRALRRVRPGFVVNYDTIHSQQPLYTVRGEPADGFHSLLLEQFCSTPVPQLKVIQQGHIAHCILDGQDVGLGSAVDLVHATYMASKRPISLSPGEPPRRAALAIGIDTPTKVLLFDVLVHKDIFPGQEPQLNMYRTAGVFGSQPGNRREIDRLDLLEAIQSLGHGLAKFRSLDTPTYQDMIRFVCQQRGWNANELRGYRCRIEYPMYSSEIVMSFDVRDTALQTPSSS